MKITNNKGFTMVELLIVLAIIAILAAVAIPVYSNQLEKSREKVDESNLRAATGLASQDYLLRYTAKGETKDVKYLVLGFTDNLNYDVVESENMAVYPENARINKRGEVVGEGWDWNAGPGEIILPDANKFNDYYDRFYWPLEFSDKKVYDKHLAAFPLQQNKGRAHFNITIGENGVIKKSEIVLEGRKHI